MRFKAVCFDLDGTLLDTLDDLAYCTNKILSERGYPIHHVDSFRYFVGDGAKMLMTRVLPEEARNETLIEECRKDFETIYRECWKRRTVPYQGIPELLNALTKRKLKLAVLSNKPQEGWLMGYKKLRRRDSIDFPVLSVATALHLDKAGVCKNARIVLGSVASCPQRALQAETLLKGEKPNAELIETSAIAAAKLAKPMDNTDMTLSYRKKMATNFVKEAINEALGQ